MYYYKFAVIGLLSLISWCSGVVCSLRTVLIESRAHGFESRCACCNFFDQVTVSANNVNSVKSRLERERLQKMSLFMD